MTPGALGTATAAGTTVPFSTTGGSATFNGNQLWDLRVNVANLVVAGTQVSNVQLTNAFPATLNIGDIDDPTHTGIAPGNLNLRAIGIVGGVPEIFNLTNDSTLDMIKSSTALDVSGTFSIPNADASGNPLTVSVTFGLAGTPSTTATKACATASPRDRLFGFEDPMSWSSTVASLSQVTSPITQGCAALGIQGRATCRSTAILSSRRA